MRTHSHPLPITWSPQELPLHSNWLQRLDLNQRFPAYETSEDNLTPLLRDKLAVLFSSYILKTGIYDGSADGTAYSKLVGSFRLTEV